MTTNTAQVLVDRLNELHFPAGLFPAEDLAQLRAMVDQERAALEAEFDAKFKARITKVISRKSIGKIISSVPAAAAVVADNGDGQ